MKYALYCNVPRNEHGTVIANRVRICGMDIGIGDDIIENIIP